MPQALQPPIPQQPAQLPVPPDQPVHSKPIQHMPQLNWSHFKSEFSRKSEEDAEVDLLRTNHLIDTHAFPESPMFLSYISRRSQMMV